MVLEGKNFVVFCIVVAVPAAAFLVKFCQETSEIEAMKSKIKGGLHEDK